MRSTSEPPVRVWLEWLLGTPAPLICTRFGISRECLRTTITDQLLSYRRWRAELPGEPSLFPCHRCLYGTSERYGMRVRHGRRLCALCAVDAELLAEVRA